MRFCFVSTSRGSHFMTELLGALASSVRATGHSAELVLDEFSPLVEDLVYVVIPHEFDAWGSSAGGPDAVQRARTIALCTENPGTPWFEQTYRLVAEFGAAVSINRSSAAELRRRGIRCEHVQLGYFAGWDRWQRDETAARPIDVLYLGAADERRDPLLARIGARLWARECQFLVPPLEPRTAPRPDFLVETQKYERLASAKVLLNLHRTTSTAFEWMRFLEAICNGCVVVSEPSLDALPLVAGEHFVEAGAERIPGAIEALLDDPARLREMRLGAYDFVRERLPMAAAGGRLVELASELPHEPPANRALPAVVASTAAARPQHSSVASVAPPRRRRLPSLRSVSATLARRLSTERTAGRLAETPAYEFADPRVSVLHVAPAERELAATRNQLAANTRSEYLLVLPAAGGIFPATVERLARALDENANALFAYSMIAVLDGREAVELRGSLPWEPERLRRENWIDLPVLIRREPLLALGGWATDPALYGIEDFELWCRCAEGGYGAAHVPQVLAWHPRAESSAPRDVASLEPAATALLHERCPRLFGATPAS
ncbi:MAG TPA: hypothetical protein VK761_00650 [Solirubrobacteraceae bacterium]|jgi:hypothetical protein|nr:hypothetical protein [Solirubrobacteraceae bacterium]